MGKDQDENFTSFVLGRSPALMRVAFLLTGDRGLAEDLLQGVADVAERPRGHVGAVDTQVEG